MDNFKILNSYTNKIIKLLNELGYAWVPTTNDSEASLLKAHWILAESSGDIAYSSTDSFYEQDSYKELTFAELSDLVVLKRNDVKDATHVDTNGAKYIDLSGQWHWFNEFQDDEIKYGWVESATIREYDNKNLKPITQDTALISGAEAKLAWANGEIVEYFSKRLDEWFEVKGNTFVSVFDSAEKLRIKPQTIKVELDLPKPFEPKDNDWVWTISGVQEGGITQMLHRDGNDYPLGAWRTEEEIKQVVEQLRKIRGTNS